MSYFEQFQEKCNDPTYLADAAQGWRERMGMTVKEAAMALGIPWRTLEGVEQGRGFRYPMMLLTAMIHTDESTRHLRGKQEQK